MKQPVQLDMLFPALHDNERFIPNELARSALFSARNKNEPRRQFLQANLFHLHEGQGIGMLYTGIELRSEDDEIIWLQIMHYAKSVPMGEPFEFSIKNLVSDVNWSKNGRYYDKARECISRLKANEVMVVNEKAYGKSGALSLVEKYTIVNDLEGKPNHYRMWINPNLIVLFAGGTYTNHNWKTYLELSPVARRLADYIESHKHPFPLHVLQSQKVCDTTSKPITGWRRSVRKACEEIEKAGIVKDVHLHSDDYIYTVGK